MLRKEGPHAAQPVRRGATQSPGDEVAGAGIKGAIDREHHRERSPEDLVASATYLNQKGPWRSYRRGPFACPVDLPGVSVGRGCGGACQHARMTEISERGVDHATAVPASTWVFAWSFVAGQVLELALSVLQAVLLHRYTRSTWFEQQRARVPGGPSLTPILLVAALVGALGGVLGAEESMAPTQEMYEDPFSDPFTDPAGDPFVGLD